MTVPGDKTATTRPLQVFVATPLGLGGRGGIDRFMDELRLILAERNADTIDIAFRPSRGPSSLLFSPFYLTACIASLVGRWMSGRVDVAHINLSQGGSAYRKMIIAAVCRRLGVPYVLHLHGSHFHVFWDGASPWLDRALVRLFSGAASIIIQGSVWGEYIARRAPKASSRFTLLPSATRDVPRQHAARNEGPVRILFSGRHGARKGTRDLTAALGLIASNPHWTATLTGDGEYVRTRDEIARLGLAGRVEVPGWISVEAFEAAIGAADVLVLPSYDENLPLAIIEAFARGIAVVTTPVGAVPDIVKHEWSGLLVKPGDIPGLAAALQRIVDDSDLRATVGRNARAIYEERLNLESYRVRVVDTWWKASGRMQPPAPQGNPVASTA